jgi:ABC-type sugar transport system ATPase subunit
MFCFGYGEKLRLGIDIHFKYFGMCDFRSIAEKKKRRSAMIQVENVSKNFEKQQVLSDINLTVNEGELLCFAGPSGVGKTTLLNIVSLIERPSEGRVEIDGIYKWTFSVIQKLRREKLGYVF